MSQSRTIFQAAISMLLLLVVSAPAQASVTDSARGWAWGGGVTNNPSGYDGSGWWSVNNVNCDTNDNGTVEAAEVAAVPGCSAGPIAKYGVSVPSADGNLSGFAWSEHYGWMSFNGSDTAGCPAGNCQARREGNALKGWARILSIAAAGGNSGGWSGWVRLDPATGGVSVNGNTLSGSAWSDELGWIDFSRVTIQQVQTMKICENACDSGIQLGLGVGSPVQTVSGSRTLVACLNEANNCSMATNNANGNDVSWSSSNPAKLPVSSDKGVSVTVTPTPNIAATDVTITTNFAGGLYPSKQTLFHLSCTEVCVLERPQASVCSGQQIRGTHCGGQVCTAIGTKSCNSNWNETAP